METLPLLRAYIPGLSQCHFRFTVSHCTNHSSFPLRWRLELCGSSRRAVSSSLTQRSLWPNGGEGVFMAQSAPFSQSGATQDSLWGPYYKYPYTNYRYTHIWNYSCLSPCRDPGVLHPELCNMAPSWAPTKPLYKWTYFYWNSKLLQIVSN